MIINKKFKKTELSNFSNYKLLNKPYRISSGNLRVTEYYLLSAKYVDDSDVIDKLRKYAASGTNFFPGSSDTIGSDPLIDSLFDTKDIISLAFPDLAQFGITNLDSLNQLWLGKTEEE